VSNGKKTAKGELGRMRKKALLAYFNDLPQNFHRGTGRTVRNFSQDSKSLEITNYTYGLPNIKAEN
jgi:hypothetical protein